MNGPGLQGSFGDNNDPEPSKIDFIEWLRWDSWNKWRGTPQKEARAEFIKVAEKIVVRNDGILEHP